MQKNTAGKWIVFAFQDEGGTNPGEPVTGDAANITANVRIDGGAANAVDDTNPTELEDGYYVFDITAAEANGDLLLIAPASATANVNVIGVPGAIWTTPANFNDAAITATGAIGINWGNVENASTSVDLSATAINLCDTVTTNTDMRGTDNALLAASAPTNFSDLAITVTTGQVTVGTNNDKAGYSISGTLTTLDALDTAQDSQHSTTQSNIAALNDISTADVLTQATSALTTYDPPTKAEMDALLTTALTESYAADGSAPTVAQALFMIISFLQERSVSGTTLTCKQLDGSTTSMTFTLNDGTSPTSITRAS